MVEIIWEFIVKEEARGQFELAYGPGGAWSTLFADCRGFLGTTLLRDVSDSRHYLRVEVWENETQREQALAERSVEYAEVDAALAEWTESRTRVGIFRMLAEASVRPQGRARRTRTGETDRRSRRWN